MLNLIYVADRIDVKQLNEGPAYITQLNWTQSVKQYLRLPQITTTFLLTDCLPPNSDSYDKSIIQKTSKHFIRPQLIKQRTECES